MIIAMILMVLAIVFGIWWFMLIALIPVITAGINFCPLYAPLGINTSKESESNRLLDKNLAASQKKEKTKTKKK